MLGFNLTIYRGGTLRDGDFPGIENGEVLLYAPATSAARNFSQYDVIEKAAVEAPYTHGYPSVYRVHVRDVPFELNAPADELVYVEAWDQS